MPPSLGAILDGISYQDRYFWFNAPRLLKEDSPVSEIEFEARETGFDDLWVFYKNPICSAGRMVRGQFFQCKWHVRGNGSIGYKDLVDPKFIGTKQNSVLSYARKYRDDAIVPASEAEYVFVTPWGIHPDDVLAELHLQNSAGIDCDRLAKQSAPKKIREVRDLWKKELAITNTADLVAILEPIRLYTGDGNMRLLDEALNERLVSCGLKPLDQTSNADLYSGHYQSLMKQGRTKFTSDSFRKYCEHNDLIAKSPKSGRAVVSKSKRTIGIRRFLRLAENMEDETDEYLCLVEYFERRYINDPKDWNESVRGKIQAFVSEFTGKAEPMCVQIEAHSSIAFTAGDAIGTKFNAPISIHQRTRGRMSEWEQPEIGSAEHGLVVTEHCDDDAKIETIATCLSLTHQITANVRSYLEKAKLGTAHIVDIQLDSGSGQSVVRDGAHAVAIAEKAAQIIKEKAATRNGASIHLFAACPNAVLFFLGQLRRTFGAVQLYEFDFDGDGNGTYSPSIYFG